MNEEMPTQDIRVVALSNDPFFMFATRGILGRDRRTRIIRTAESLDFFERKVVGKIVGRIDAVICDLDSILQPSGLDKVLKSLAKYSDDMSVVCLLGNNLLSSLKGNEIVPVSALLAKSELHYCLHLVLQAVSQFNVILTTKSVSNALKFGSRSVQKVCALGPHRAHPNLSKRREEIAVLRAFVGLDNIDISDELGLSYNTVRDHVSDIYTRLGVTNEFEVFEVMSEWWWTTRFLLTLN